MTTVRVAWAVHRSRTVVLGPLQDEGRAGDSVADAGERQHLELVQHGLPETGQERRLRVVPSHDVTAGLRVQVFGPEQNLECEHTGARVVMRMRGARRGPSQPHGTDQPAVVFLPQQLCLRLADLVSIRYGISGEDALQGRRGPGVTTQPAAGGAAPEP